MYQKIAVYCLILCALLPLWGNAQNLSVSPYSRYGVGDIFNASTTRNAAMGGVSIGVGNFFSINRANPAAYPEMRRTTLDLGGFGQASQLNVPDKPGESQYTAGLQNLSVGFPSRRVGFALGLAPYSAVGYDIAQTYDVNLEDSTYTATSNYSADGGLNQAFFGFGIRAFKGLNLGANLSYSFGTTNTNWNTLVTDRPDIRPTTLEDRVFANGIGGQFGALYTAKLKYTDKESDSLLFRVGATVELSGELRATRLRLLNNALILDSLEGETTGRISLPAKYSVGFEVTEPFHWTVAGDVVFQDWSNFNYFEDSSGLAQDFRINLGGEYIPNFESPKYFSRVAYRLGGYFHQTYLTYNENPVNDMGVSFGFGFSTSGRKQSVREKLFSTAFINLSFEFGKRGSFSADQPLEELYGRFRLGVTVNERWFVRRKVD